MLFRSLRPLTARATSLATTFPRPNTLIGPICVRTLATKEASDPSTSSAPAESNTPRQLSYFVGRNNLNNLSVYHKKKRGGNYMITLIKGGEGDLQALKQDVKEALQLPDSDLSINNVTRHIQIRGHKRDEVVNFLHTMGF